MKTLSKIFSIVSTHTDLPISAKCRKREYIRARAVYVEMASRHTRQSLSSIGGTMGRDHATVIHYQNNIIPEMKAQDKGFNSILDECEDIFCGLDFKSSMSHKIARLEEEVDELTKRLARQDRPIFSRMLSLPPHEFQLLEERIRPILLFLDRDRDRVPQRNPRVTP